MDIIIEAIQPGEKKNNDITNPLYITEPAVTVKKATPMKIDISL